MKLIDFSMHGMPWDSGTESIWIRVTVEHEGKRYIISKDQLVGPFDHELTPATKLELLATSLVELFRLDIAQGVEHRYSPEAVKL